MNLTIWVSCLYHKALDDSVEYVAIIITILAMYTEIFNCLRTPVLKREGTLQCCERFCMKLLHLTRGKQAVMPKIAGLCSQFWIARKTKV